MQEFDDLCLRIRHAAELAEAAVEDIHSRMGNLSRLGLFGDSLYLGKQIWQKPASDLAECEDLGIVYQPALWTIHGYGIVVWDAAEFLQLREVYRLTAEARNYFKPFCNCREFEKALIQGEQAVLLEKLRVEYFG